MKEYPDNNEHIDPEDEPKAPATEPENEAPPKRRKNILINVLLVICICGVAVAIFMIVRIFWQYSVPQKEYEDVRNSYATSDVDTGPRFIDLASLRAVNPECIGWIEIPGTNIDYPLMHTTDNVKYLEVTFEGTWNPSGAIYLDAENTADFAMANSIIYGHHMKDGSMFAGLASFLREDYRNAHNEILIYTEEGIRHYEVFSASTVLTTDRPMSIWFDDAEQEGAFLSEMGGNLALSPDDRIITLVTCVNSVDSSDQRHIVQAVLRSIEDMPEPGQSGSQSQSASSSQ